MKRTEEAGIKTPTSVLGTVVCDADSKTVAEAKGTFFSREIQEQHAAEISVSLNERAELRAEVATLRSAIQAHGFVVNEFVRAYTEICDSMKARE